MCNSYSTIAADVEAEQPLINNAPKRNAKLLVGGAAAAAFVLGFFAVTATSSPGLLGAAFHSSAERVQIKTATDHGMCMAVQEGKAVKHAKLVYEPCTTKTPGQVFDYDKKNGQIRYDGMCVDALGGASFTAGGNFGLYKCKKGDRNSALVVADTGDQTITLKSQFGGETICMTAMQIYGGTKYIKGEACRGNEGVVPLQQWNLIPASTPVPPPTPGTATYDCPWSPKRQGKDKPCMTDAQCNGAWLGPGAHMCSKCHNSVVGARAICGPK